MKHHLLPLEPPYPEEISTLFEKYPRGEDGYLLRLFRVFANSLRFLGGKGALNLLDGQSPLTLRERELVILRVTANNRCEYEWGVHVSIFAEAAGFTAAQVAATCSIDSVEGCWNDDESLLIACVDQLCARATLDNEKLEKFQSRWTQEQQLEILALCGNYHLISFVANTARLENEAFGARFARN